MSNKPKKMVRNSCLDEPMSKGKPVDKDTLMLWKQVVTIASKKSKMEIVENEREARQFLKGKIIK